MNIVSKFWHGITLVSRSIQILFMNPILFIYSLLALLGALARKWNLDAVFGSPHKEGALEIYNVQAIANPESWQSYLTIFVIPKLLIILNIFFLTCLAYHCFNILQKREVSLYTTLYTIIRHKLLPILLWSIMLMLYAEILITPKAKTYSLIHALQSTGQLPDPAAGYLMGAALLGTLIVIEFFMLFVIPLIANEATSLLNAIKKSVSLCWQNLSIFVGASVGTMLILYLIQLGDFNITALQYLFFIITFPLSTLVFTLFYHEQKQAGNA